MNLYNIDYVYNIDLFFLCVPRTYSIVDGWLQDRLVSLVRMESQESQG